MDDEHQQGLWHGKGKVGLTAFGKVGRSNKVNDQCDIGEGRRHSGTYSHPKSLTKRKSVGFAVHGAESRHYCDIDNVWYQQPEISASAHPNWPGDGQ
jgi:hypothetical protein